MAAKSKVVGGFREAVADIPDGSTIAFGGFAMPGTPFNLIKALLEQGAKRLTLVGNTTGGAQQPRMPDMGMLVENGQVAKVICAFTAATRSTCVRFVSVMNSISFGAAADSRADSMAMIAEMRVGSSGRLSKLRTSCVAFGARPSPLEVNTSTAASSTSSAGT